MFASILDPGVGGSWRLSPEGAAVAQQRYVIDTNVLETVHTTQSGRVRVRDFLVLGEDSGSDESVLVRRAVGLDGEVAMETAFAPRFQYGRVSPRFRSSPTGLIVSGAGECALVQGAPEWERAGAGARRVAFTLRAGETRDFVLRHTRAPVLALFTSPGALANAAAMEEATTARWRAWAARTLADGPYAPWVRRSALVLKLLQFRRNGAFVAAGTTSLPESVGGVRNWDYRYTWIRDGAFTARALHEVGHADDAARFADWLRETIGDDARDLRIMYTVSGSTDLPERVLPHLAGYRGSAPVRVGNAAVEQRQLDVYGELVEFLGALGGPAHWPLVRSVARWVAVHWPEPDQGIWEMRCEPRHFVLSKAMACVALERATRFAIELGEAPDPHWLTEAALIRTEIDARGYDAQQGAFVQAYDVPWLDASNLMLPLCGFLDARDPRMIATVDRTMADLMVDGLVYRYRGHDGLPGTEGTFAYCTFWLVEVLARQGRTEEARAIFERIVARASPLGLYSEEIEVATGELVGNFPQAFPHAGLIQAARALTKSARS